MKAFDLAEDLKKAAWTGLKEQQDMEHVDSRSLKDGTYDLVTPRTRKEFPRYHATEKSALRS